MNAYLKNFLAALNNAKAHVATKMFQPTDPNPTTRGTGAEKNDCVIRAFAIAEGLSWLESFDILVENARQTYCVPNDSANYEVVFEKRGYKRTNLVAEGNVMTIAKLATIAPKGTYIVRTDSHLTTIVDGVIRDAFNTSEMLAFDVWEK